jgi:hypothetical protein
MKMDLDRIDRAAKAFDRLADTRLSDEELMEAFRDASPILSDRALLRETLTLYKE